jgi:hypothetical protein
VSLSLKTGQRVGALRHSSAFPEEDTRRLEDKAVVFFKGHCYIFKKKERRETF